MFHYRSFINSFVRKPASGVYYPEIDGLRFLSLVLIITSHVFVAWRRTVLHTNTSIASSWPKPLLFILNNGESTVIFFFVLSGYIISYPFVRSYVKGKSLSLKNFYLRRLVRIEPPYFILTTAFLLVYLAKGWYHIHYYGPHYAASMVYLHNIIFPKVYGLNDVTWTLEVEIQFYMLAPLFCQVFRLHGRMRNAVLFLLTCILLALPYYIKLPFISLFNFAGYFFVGMMVANATVHGGELLKKYYLPIKIITGVALFFLLFGYFIRWDIFLLFLPLTLFCVSYGVLNTGFWKRIFSYGLFPVIGGMCYTTYLLHNLFITFIFLYGIYIPGQSITALLLNIGWMMIVIFIIGAVVFKIVEQPFMKFSTRFPVFINKKKAASPDGETASTITDKV